jgi:hypothetical protein
VDRSLANRLAGWPVFRLGEPARVYRVLGKVVITSLVTKDGEADMALEMNPWKVGNRVFGVDPQLRRVWVGGQRLHHGLTGVAVVTAGLAQLATGRAEASRAIAWTLAGGFLMAHDWKDRSVWFQRGPQA